jgi:hypothetical protein
MSSGLGSLILGGQPRNRPVASHVSNPVPIQVIHETVGVSGLSDVRLIDAIAFEICVSVRHHKLSLLMPEHFAMQTDQIVTDNGGPAHLLSAVNHDPSDVSGVEGREVITGAHGIEIAIHGLTRLVEGHTGLTMEIDGAY